MIENTMTMTRQNTSDAINRYSWINKNKYYHEDLARFYSFHVEKGKKVIEIGFGTGFILNAVKPSMGLGIDISPVTAEDGKKIYPQFDFHHWSGNGEIPLKLREKFKDGVDYILLVNMHGYWDDIQVALNNLRGLCNKDTRIISNYYNFAWAPIFKVAQKFNLKMPQPTANWLSADDVTNLFKISGFRVIKQGFRCLLPKNIPVLSVLLNRFISPLPFFNQLALTHFVIARVPAVIALEALKVTVVIPARNEKGNIEAAVRRLAVVQRDRKEKFEIIFVEGNSTDDTYSEIERVIRDPLVEKPFPVRLFRQTGKGKGDAVRLGFSKAQGDLLMILDADLTVTPEDLVKFIDVYSAGYGEFINGCRLVYKMEKEAMRPLNLLGNKFFGMAFSYLLGQRFKDTLCGTKVVSRENYNRIAAGRDYFGDFDPFGDFDLIFGASKLDLEIAEVPIRYKERTYGTTNISRFKHGWLLLKMCFFALGKIKFVP